MKVLGVQVIALTLLFLVKAVDAYLTPTSSRTISWRAQKGYARGADSKGRSITMKAKIDDHEEIPTKRMSVKTSRRQIIRDGLVCWFNLHAIREIALTKVFDDVRSVLALFLLLHLQRKPAQSCLNLIGMSWYFSQ